MKIKQIKKSYSEVMALPKAKHYNPKRPGWLFPTLVRLLSVGVLRKTQFEYSTDYAEILDKGPCLILMNHSSFIDLQMASKILLGTSLVIQWLRLQASSARGVGSIPGQGNEDPTYCAVWPKN